MNVLPMLWTILSVQTHLASGLPLTATTSSTTITEGWVADPPQRGTFSIITSCILTMGLCIWSALHLNIPSKGQGTVQFWLQNVKWMLVGLLAPELVIFAAWRQYISARTLQHKINGLGVSKTKLSSITAGTDRIPPVTMAFLYGSVRHLLFPRELRSWPPATRQIGR